MTHQEREVRHPVRLPLRAVPATRSPPFRGRSGDERFFDHVIRSSCDCRRLARERALRRVRDRPIPRGCTGGRHQFLARRFRALPETDGQAVPHRRRFLVRKFGDQTGVCDHWQSRGLGGSRPAIRPEPRGAGAAEINGDGPSENVPIQPRRPHVSLVQWCPLSRL